MKKNSLGSSRQNGYINIMNQLSMVESTALPRKPFPLVSVIIPARDEAKTILRVIHEAQKIAPKTEIIVVSNGNKDNTEELGRQGGARVIHIDSTLGYDVGRAVGAYYSKGEILLFIDGDFVIPASKLRKYCIDVWNGFDLVLNAYSGSMTSTSIHPTSQAKRLFNKLLQRPDLKGSSLTTIPHAISRNALEVIGAEALMVPPKAQAIAVYHELKIKRGHYINVAKLNRKRDRGTMDEVEQLIIGDHVEALVYLTNTYGQRGGFSDFWRKRNLFQEAAEYKVIREKKGKMKRSKQDRGYLSVIISVYNEEETIGQLLKEVKKLRPKEIIVVENGSTDRTLLRCVKHGVRCIKFPQKIGHDVGRGIGAREATGDILLFLDGDMVIEAEKMLPFVKACLGEADIALNNLNPFYTHSAMIDHVSMAKAFLNRFLLHPHLQYSSLTAIPHAMKKSAAKLIGYENLAIPPKAQAIAVLNGLSIEQVEGVNVFQLNKRKTYNQNENNNVEHLILGDHIEAFHWAQTELGDRGRLIDHNRSRYIFSFLEPDDY